MTDTNRQVLNTENSSQSCFVKGFSSTSNHSGISSLTVSFDWLEFTIFDASLHQVFEQVLQFPAQLFIHAGAGSYGYRDKHVLIENKHIVVLSNGSAEQGIHVQLSSRGCAYLLHHLSAEQLIDNVLRFRGRFSRVDLALDDRDCIWYSTTQLQRHIRRQEIISKWREVTMDISQSLHDSQIKKEIIYFGSPRSNYSLCIYNKTLEQRKSLMDSEAIAALPPQWMRWEITCRRSRAQALILELIQQQYAMGTVFAGLLSGSIRIACNEGIDSNRSRWPTQPKWQKFIGAAQPLRLFVPKPETDLLHTGRWIKKYVMPTMAAWMQTKDGFARFLEMLSEGEHAIKRHHRVQVDNYNARVWEDDNITNTVKEDSVPYVRQLFQKVSLPKSDLDEHAS